MKKNFWVLLTLLAAGAIGCLAALNLAHAQPAPRPTQTVHGAVYDAIFNQCMVAEEYGDQAKSILAKGGDYSSYLTWTEGQVIAYNGADVDHLRIGVGPQVGRVIFKEKFSGDVFKECMNHPERFDVNR